MKTSAYILLAFGYVILFTGPEHSSDIRLGIALLSFGIAFILGLQIYKVEKKNWSTSGGEELKVLSGPLPALSHIKFIDML